MIAPAIPAIRYDRVVFSSGFGIEKSPFQGQPSEVNDKLWAGLYDCRLCGKTSHPFILPLMTDCNSVGISGISAVEARPMDNKTLPIPGQKGEYVIQLAVFHQLHCLVGRPHKSLYALRTDKV